MALTDPAYDSLEAQAFAPAPQTTEAPAAQSTPRPQNILDPGFDLTLRPMRYPQFFDMYRDASPTLSASSRPPSVTWSTDWWPSSPPATRSWPTTWCSTCTSTSTRQLYEEALHVQFYLTLLDNYIPDMAERQAAFAAVENIPSIKQKADFCFKYMDSMAATTELNTKEERRQFLMNLICFATCIEGLFFFAAFAYVYFLRSKGLLNGLADGTNWVFRDESGHMNFALEVVNTVRAEEPDLFDDAMNERIGQMISEAVDAEFTFAQDLLSEGVTGMSLGDTREYLEYVADQRLGQLGLPPRFGASNPFAFMELQDVQQLSNFFERTVSSYQVGIEGTVNFDEDF